MVTDPYDMATATYAHFDALLGSEAPRECALDLSALITPTNLDDMYASFDSKEIWQAVKQLPTRKAPGPDSYTVEFLHVYWPIVRQSWSTSSGSFTSCEAEVSAPLTRRSSLCFQSPWTPVASEILGP